MAALTKITCPECGGVLGTPGPGEVICTCPLAPAPSLIEDGEDEKSDTVAMSAPVAPETPVAQKPCALCGRELAGHRRYRDSRGYICRACMKAEEEDKIAGRVACPLCKRKVREAGIVMHAGQKMCRSCFLNIKESKKVLVHKVASKHFEIQERQSLLVLLGVLGVLLIFMILGALKYKMWR